MPRKYQNGKLEIRSDVERPYYFVRFTRPVIDKATGQRVKRRTAQPLGFVDDTPRRQAMELRAQCLEMVNAGRMLAQSQLRFRDIAQRFLDIRVPQLGIATQNKYRIQINKHILPAFGAMQMHEVDRSAVEQFLTSKATLSWWTRIDLKGVLSAIFTAARSWKLFEGDNPTEGVRIGHKRMVREKRLIKPDELRLILASLGDPVRLIVEISFGLGLRISEVLGLQWRDFDFQAGTVTIRRRWYRGDLSEETKSEAGARVLMLGDRLTSELKTRCGPWRFVFLGDDGVNPPDERDLLREQLRPVLKNLKLYYPGFGWHAFRRANVTYRQHAGATPLEAQRAAGHSTLDMTMLYTLRDAEREKRQVDAMFDRLIVPEGPKQ